MASRITALIITPLYTGAILSFLLTQTIKLPFNNVQEFVQDGSYKLGFTKITQLDEFFQVSTRFLINS